MGLQSGRSWVAKPGGFARVNFDHPITRQMVGCWLLNEGGAGKVFADIGPFAQPTESFVGTSARTVGPYGIAFDCGAAANYFTVIRAGAYFVNGVGGPGTIVAAVYPTANSPAGEGSSIASFGQVHDSNWSFGIGLAGAGGTAGHLLELTSNRGAITDTAYGPSMTLNAWNLVGASNLSLTSRLFLCNGVITSDTTSMTSHVPCASGISIGACFLNGAVRTQSILNGQIAFVYAWDRNLLASELLAIAANPWLFLQPQGAKRLLNFVQPGPMRTLVGVGQ